MCCSQRRTRLKADLPAVPNETRAVSLALINAVRNLAQIYSAYLSPSSDAPMCPTGFGGHVFRRNGLILFSICTLSDKHKIVKKTADLRPYPCI